VSISSDNVFKPSVLSVREFLIVLRLSAATVTETAATTARESQDNEPTSNGNKLHERVEERRTDFNDEKEAHEEEVCDRKKGAPASDCESES
jgi:hypothetical protein